MFSLTSQALHLASADLLVAFMTTDELNNSSESLLAELNAAAGIIIQDIAATEHFKAKTGQTFLLRGLSGLKAPRLLLVGLGEETSADAMQDAGARAAMKAKSMRASHVAVQPHSAGHLAELATGLRLGAYTYTTYRTPDEDAFKGITQVDIVAQGDDAKAQLERAQILGEAINYTRDLVNAPPQDLYPASMADSAVKIAEKHGLEHTIFDDSALEEKGFNLIMAVGKGAEQKPRLIHLTYTPAGEVKHTIAFVGKGVTFDTGGNNIKTGGHMWTMHCDMAGGGAVLGAADAIGALKPDNVKVHFIVPAAENSVSGNAMRPNDVYRGYGNKTVEIGNTDAEGRLCLADALAYAQELGAETIIDLATLTGACVVALGDHTSGLFTDSDELLGELETAIAQTGEDFWRLPLHKKLDKKLDSNVADMNNIGKGYGGAITAALFLKRWITIDRWAHLDIAAPAYTEAASDTLEAGGTGFGVSTLVALTEHIAKQ